MNSHALQLVALCVVLAGSPSRAGGYNLISRPRPAATSPRYVLIGDTTPAAVAESPARRRQVVLITSRGCVPCQRFATVQRPRMERAGWTFGDSGDRSTHFRVIDAELEAAAAAEFRAAVVPTFVLIVDGREAGRVTGYQTAETLNQFYRGAK